MNARASLSEARPIPRRGLSRDEAAMYVGIGATKFDAMVADGRMPKPKLVDGQKIWDVRALAGYIPEKPEPKVDQPTPRVHEIYVIGFGDYVKIGYSAAFVYRLRDLQAGVPEPLTVYARFAGRQPQERALHRRFSAHRLRGEWFRRAGELADWIERGCPQ